jgi:hypothetical protein
LLLDTLWSEIEEGTGSEKHPTAFKQWQIQHGARALAVNSSLVTIRVCCSVLLLGLWACPSPWMARCLSEHTAN